MICQAADDGSYIFLPAAFVLISKLPGRNIKNVQRGKFT